jgi:hypothetical protein
MALERWAQGALNPKYCAGTVLFDITRPGGNFRSYHVMLVRDGITQTGSSGKIEVPISDMTGKQIQWPDHNAWHELHTECFAGYFPELTMEQTREALEELCRLRRTQTATGPEFYTLATHGILQDDPNAPGNPGVSISCSCASLIEHCYEKSGVDLVRADRVPPITAEKLWSLVGNGTAFRGVHRDILARWGLVGDGPWPVLLPAYQMRAFDAPLSSLSEYQPVPEHHPYP